MAVSVKCVRGWSGDAIISARGMSCTRSPFSTAGIGETTCVLINAPRPFPSATFAIETPTVSGAFAKRNIAAAILRELVSRVLFDDMIEVLDPEPHDAALNMAIDETLLRVASRPTLRIYRWARPAVSFGYFGKWSDAVAAGPGREIVRRWTGGGIVPHGEDLTFSLIVPRAHPVAALPPRESYRVIHECVARALGNASLAAVASLQSSAACFENPVQNDVLIADRKVAGGAQRRTKCGLLHQGSIQNITSIALLAPALRREFSSRRSALPLALEIQIAAALLSQERYATDEWTRRVA